MMNALTFEAFKSKAMTDGFDEVLERQWAADTVLETHSHPFSVEALVTQGELWLTVAGDTRHIPAGQTFTLPSDTPHIERYGPQGASFWVARKNRA